MPTGSLDTTASTPMPAAPTLVRSVASAVAASVTAVGEGVRDVAAGDRVAWAMVNGTGYTSVAAVPTRHRRGHFLPRLIAPPNGSGLQVLRRRARFPEGLARPLSGLGPGGVPSAAHTFPRST